MSDMSTLYVQQLAHDLRHGRPPEPLLGPHHPPPRHRPPARPRRPRTSRLRHLLALVSHHGA